MKVSIALASFEGAATIEEQLDSFSRQTMLPDEVIVSDDRSRDNTVELVRNFAKLSGLNIKLIRNERNLGHIRNFSNALLNCTGDIVFLSDQDDKWFPEKIETVTRVFLENSACWAVIHDGMLTNSHLIPTGQTKIAQVRRGYGSAKNICTGALSAFRQDLLRYALPFPPSIAAHDAWLHSLAMMFPGRRVVLEQNLQYIRRHDANTSSWIVNSESPIRRFDVALAQAKESPADSYKDRLVMNKNLAKACDKMYNCFVDPTALRALHTYQVRLELERRALHARQSLINSNSFKRKILAFSMLLSGKYEHFNGLRSFARDIFR